MSNIGRIELPANPDYAAFLSITEVHPAKVIRELAGIDTAAGDAWGYSVSMDPFYVTFDNVKTDDVIAAVNAFPAEALKRIKDVRLEQVADIRRDHLLVGPMGLTLDATTMGRIGDAWAYLKEDDAVQTVRWEMSRNNWQTLPRTMFVGEGGLIVQIGRYTQGTFARSEVLMGLIAGAETVSEVMDLDITTGWPSWS